MPALPLVTLPQSGGDTFGLTGDYVTISTGIELALYCILDFFPHVVGFARIPRHFLCPSWSYLSFSLGGILLSACLGGQVWKGFVLTMK